MNTRYYISIIISSLLISITLLSGCKDKKDEMIELYQSMPHDSRFFGTWECCGMDMYREYSPNGFVYEYIRDNKENIVPNRGSIVWYTEKESILHECPLYRRPIEEHQPHGYRISNDTIYIFRFGEWTPNYVRFHGELK